MVIRWALDPAACKVTIVAAITEPEASVTVPRTVPNAAVSVLVCATEEGAAKIMQRMAVPRQVPCEPPRRRIYYDFTHCGSLEIAVGTPACIGWSLIPLLATVSAYIGTSLTQWWLFEIEEGGCVKRFLLIVGFAIATASVGFTQSANNQPRFEVASVKPSPPGETIGSMSGGPLPVGPFNMKRSDPRRITWTNIRLMRVLMMAYDLPPDRISGPGWLGSNMYDILATMPEGTAIADFKLMVQNLLAERFQLVAHRATKEVAGYWLEVAATGLKIKESRKNLNSEPADASASKSDLAIGTPPGTFVDKSGFLAPLPDNPSFPPGSNFAGTIKVNDMYRATVLNEPLSSIAKFLGTAAGMPVEDHTGLTGTYDFHLEYKPNLSNVVPGGGAESPRAVEADVTNPGPDLLDAVQSQLGLKLVRKRVPKEMLIIDHVEKVPTEN